MRIHVTGATGFVGRHLIKEAERRGHEVVALVRRRDERLACARQIEIGDIAERVDWSEAVAGADAVVHLAARVHVMKETSTNADLEYARVNVAPTLRLAQAAADARVGRFVFVSSIKVNGELTSGAPFTAESVPRPADAYGRSKHLAEIGLREIAEDRGLGVAILRPTVVYGPEVGGNIRRIGRAVAKRIPMPLASVHNSRSMLSVDNLARGALAAAQTELRGSGVFLLSDREPISTRRLVELLAEGSGVRPCLLPVPAGLLRLAGKVLGRGADAARLLDDLVVVPNWDRLGVADADLRSTADAMRAVGSSIRQGA